MQKRTVAVGIMACVLALVIAGLCVAQPQGGGPGGRQGGGRQGGGGQFGDPAERQARMMEMMREQLQVTDDAAWKVMQPRLAKVMELSQGQGMGGRGMGGMMGGRNRGGDAGGRAGGRAQRDPSTMTAVEKAQEALRTTLENTSASPEEINKALTALRQARENARRELAQAQAELQKILTPRQEAQLVMMGQLN